MAAAAGGSGEWGGGSRAFSHSVGTAHGAPPDIQPPAPVAISPVSARRSLGGGGGCKGITRKTVVPSTDASKENTCEATFALMQCQCDSSNTNVIGDHRTHTGD